MGDLSVLKQICTKSTIVLILMILVKTSTGAEITVNQKDSIILLKTGEKLFRQKPDSLQLQLACIHCHYLVVPDTFSLNPAANELIATAQNLTSSEFTELITDPLGSDRLMDAHQYSNLNAEELQALQFYLSVMQAKTTKERTCPDVNSILFLAGLLFLILTIIEYSRRKNLVNKTVRRIVFATGLTLCGWVTIAEARLIGNSLNYEPDQPIRFSHLVHAGENKLDCKFCHASAEHAAIAGIPSTRQCYFCHFQIREGSLAGEFELKKVLTAWELKKPIEWTRVCNLPDHVKFDHSAHVKSANIECKFCHGQVEIKHRIKQENSMTMKWCLDCHNRSYINLIKSEYYINISPVYSDSVLFSKIGGNDCITCHF